MKSIAIIGANGFIGSYLANSFSDCGYNVIAIIRSYKTVSLNKGIQSVHSIGDFEVFRGWHKLLDKTHLAVFCIGKSATCPKSNNEEIILQNIKDQCKELKFKPDFIYLSSLSVYDYTKIFNITSTTKTNPVTKYGRIKLSCETILWKEYKSAFRKLFILRLPHVYGVNCNGYLNLLLNRVVNSKFIPLSSHNHKRSVISLNNLRMFIKYFLNWEDTSSGTFLIQDNSQVSLYTCLGYVKTKLKSKALIFVLPPVFPAILKHFAHMCQFIRSENRLSEIILRWINNLTIEEEFALKPGSIRIGDQIEEMERLLYAGPSRMNGFTEAENKCEMQQE